MPEKTKLEDYANMNNTGFAFIDLNEEFKNTINYYLSDYEDYRPDGFLANYSNNKEEIGVDLSNDYEYGFEIEKCFKKIKEIYESKKPLIIKIKFDIVVDTGTTYTHKFYDTIIKDCVIYYARESYHIIVNIGSAYSLDTKNLTSNSFSILKINISENTLGIFSYSK